MDYKIRKLKTVGLRQNAPDAQTMRLNRSSLPPSLVTLASSSVLAFAVALTVLPRPAIVLVSLAVALAIRFGAGRAPDATSPPFRR